MVIPFDETQAVQLASLLSSLKAKGQQMKLYDAAIAATAISRGDQLLALDSDFDRLSDRLTILKP